ncbi:MAG: peptidase M61, partial [Terriglobia bacterium]
MLNIILLAVFSLALPSLGYSQRTAGPQPVPLPPPVKAPVDKPYPGTISLAVSVRDITHRVIGVHETIPVQQGGLTLL